MRTTKCDREGVMSRVTVLKLIRTNDRKSLAGRNNNHSLKKPKMSSLLWWKPLIFHLFRIGISQIFQKKLRGRIVPNSFAVDYRIKRRMRFSFMPPFGFPIFPDFLSAGENVFCNSEMPVHVFNYGRMSIDHSFSYCSYLLKCTQNHSVWKSHKWVKYQFSLWYCKGQN